MFASVENRSQVEIRINDGEGKSVVIAKGEDINVARQIVDLLNRYFVLSSLTKL